MTNNLLDLTIGAILELESTNDDFLGELQSEIIDYTPDQSLTMTHPNKDSVLAQVDTGDSFFVCLKHGDTNVSFETEVVAVITTPHPQILTTYPKEVRTGSLRKSNRVPAAPVNVHLITDNEEPDIPISIVNISVSGACLVSEKQLGVVNNYVQIDILTDTGQPTVKVSCMIRHVRDMSSDNHPTFHHGVEFIGMDAEVQLFLWKFVQESSLPQVTTD